MSRRNDASLVLGGVVLLAIVIVLGFQSGVTQSIIGQSQVSLSPDDNYWLISATTDTRESITFQKDSVTVQDSEGRRATPKSTIKLVLEPVSTTYYAPSLKMISDNQGDLGICQLYIPIGQQCIGYERTGLTPYQFQAGVTQVRYKVKVYKNDVLQETKEISYGKTDSGQLQNAQGISGDTITLLNGDVVIRNVAQLGGGYSKPELSDVSVSFDSDTSRWTSAVSRQDLAQRVINTAGRFYFCGDDFNQAYYRFGCRDKVHKILNLQLQPSDNLRAPSGYGNFIQGTQSFSGSEGSWQLYEGSTYALATISISTRLADTVFVGNDVAKPVVISVTAADTTQGRINQVKAQIRNDGPAGSVDIRAVSEKGNYIVPSKIIVFQQGESKEVSLDFYGQILGNERFTVTACGVSQFTQPTCSTGSATVRVVGEGEGGTGSDVGGPGSDVNCQRLGTGWSFDADLKKCVKVEGGGPLSFPVVLLGLGVLAAMAVYIVFSGKGRTIGGVRK